MMNSMRTLMIALLVGVVAGCTAGNGLESKEQPLSFPNAGGIVYLRSFGSQFDINPPSGFSAFILGEDAADHARPVKPFGIAVGMGKIYVNDGRRKSGYWVLDLAKQELNLIQHPSVLGSLGIAVDDRDYKYLVSPRLADAKAKGTKGTKEEEGRIIVFDHRNRLVTTKDIIGRLVDVDVWKDRLFITDGLNHRVLIVDKTRLDVVGEFGKLGSGQGEFSFPKGIAVSGDGRIFVGDMFNGRIKVFDQNGNFISQYGNIGRVLGSFSRISGLDVDQAGMVYAIDSSYQQKLVRDEIQIFDSSQFYGKGESVPSLQTKLEDRKNALRGYFQKPYGIAALTGVNAANSLYAPLDIVVDYKNTSYFQHLAPSGTTFKYLIWMSSQFAANGKDISLFALAEDKKDK